ncbi:SDR family NAD(P)-dependent oxidoreductase [Kozakia baliensis]|uniref:SDR family NAD(P)-dependent oxidoreductase n=1 Tax=Kozakia baliensis TaxID=153496 RepID=UPI00068D0F7E|nr:SDR family NAD(P)-dependent oxidoreductase [Kozakia baliensis]
MSGTPFPWALVTGASSGLGVEFARALAEKRINLVLAARRDGPMHELAEELRQRHGVEVEVEAIDLSEPGSAAQLLKRLDSRGLAPRILINNAAFGFSGDFIAEDAAKLRAMLQLDIVTLTELTQLFAQRMVAQGSGSILLVASLAGFQPIPYMAAYSAATAYILSLGEALNVELGPNVKVSVLCPGLMETEFLNVAGYTIPSPMIMRRTMLSPADVAHQGLRALARNKPSFVAGKVNRIAAFGNRFSTRHLQARIAARTAR